jgi:hypothetical protein
VRIILPPLDSLVKSCDYRRVVLVVSACDISDLQDIDYTMRSRLSNRHHAHQDEQQVNNC